MSLIPKILILDDDKNFTELLFSILKNEDNEVFTSNELYDFFTLFEEKSPEIIILDVCLAEENLSGLDILEKIQEINTTNFKTIIVSANSHDENIAKALKLGAYSFIEKGANFSIERLLLEVNQAIETKTKEDNNIELQIKNLNLKKRLLKFPFFLGDSSVIKDLNHQILQFSRIDAPILITGEKGAGVNNVANKLYSLSRYSGSPFRVLDCNRYDANKLDELICGELFKNDKKTQKKKCLLEICSNGVLVLNEFHNINYETQLKLLNIIEKNRIKNTNLNVNTRFIFTTSKPLHEIIKNKIVIEQLFYILEENSIFIPPLNQREEDIPYIISSYINSFSKIYDNILSFNVFEIKKEISDYNWPENIREVKNFCELLTIRHNIITNRTIIEELNYKIKNNFTNEIDNKLQYYFETIPFEDAVKKFEKSYLSFHYTLNNRRPVLTSRAIKLERTTLYKKLKKYDIK